MGVHAGGRKPSNATGRGEAPTVGVGEQGLAGQDICEKQKSKTKYGLIMGVLGR